MTKQELELSKKNELKKDSEKTRAEKIFVPEVDICEKSDLLLLQANMPGVTKDNVEISLHENVLKISGRISPDEYQDLNPLYSEYNVGHYERTFDLGEQINQEKIEAKVNDGVLSLVLPKAEKKKPRTIPIK